MHPMERLAQLLEWAGPDLAHNLDFIPEDRLDWKPTPDSKSARECAAEAALLLKSMIPVRTAALPFEGIRRRAACHPYREAG
jgi:hypothetical protein